TDGLSYNPSEEIYWDPQALEKELTRVFEICHGCRMCFKYCDTFPNLFNLLDNKYNGDVRPVVKNKKELDYIMSACFQCKLCEVQCPYTPRDGHEYQLDFPKLVHRYKAIEHKKKGSTLRDKVLSEPDLSGKMARMSFGLANMMNKVKIHRWFMEKLLGIHKDKLLPDFAQETFEKWAKRNKKGQQTQNPEVVLFQTCYVQNNEPQIGKDTVSVLEQNNVSYACISGFECCGMPSWEHGDLESLRKKAKHNLKLLKPFIEKEAKVLVINPTCAMMMRNEYPDLVDPADKPLAQKLSKAIRDTGEYLWSLKKEGRFNTHFQSSPGEKVGYHAPCHLRAQAVGFKGRDLIRSIPGVQTKMVMECCGHDGTFAMKKESYEESIKIGQKAFKEMKSTQSEVWSTECPLAALQFQQHAGVKPLHPMSVLARAYKKDGFPFPVKPEESLHESSKK
ncbi:MAG: anaerobic glycerol-3-phosphate dehydrogenase subunit C, partial [Bdellovibrio sp.]